MKLSVQATYDNFLKYHVFVSSLKRAFRLFSRPMKILQELVFSVNFYTG